MLKKMIIVFISILFSYLAISLIVHNFLLPEKEIVFSEYFRPGQIFSSKLEGIKQTVLKVDNNNLTTELTIYPKASGPVAHIHENFDEKFIVKKGILTLLIGTETKTLAAGEEVVIPKNTPHKPYNLTNETVIVTSTMPTNFGYCLSQIYPFWDEHPSHAIPPKILFQLAAFGSKFDSYPIENAPPKPALKFIKFILAPTARLLGYKNYNEKYKPKAQ